MGAQWEAWSQIVGNALGVMGRLGGGCDGPLFGRDGMWDWKLGNWHLIRAVWDLWDLCVCVCVRERWIGRELKKGKGEEGRE